MLSDLLTTGSDVKVLELFVLLWESSFTQADVAGLTQLSRQTVAPSLARLHDAGLLLRGGNQYRCNLGDEASVFFIGIMGALIRRSSEGLVGLPAEEAVRQLRALRERKTHL